MSKNAHKHAKHKRPDPVAGAKSKPAYFMIFVLVLVAFSLLAILICSGTWVPW